MEKIHMKQISITNSQKRNDTNYFNEYLNDVIDTYQKLMNAIQTKNLRY